MLLTITLVLSVLIAINFLLLIFSCNKTTKRVKTEEKKQPTFIVTKNTTKQQTSTQLAPTGS
jgi:hypothetical protein